MDIRSTRDYLQALDFKTLFNELGWNQPKSIRTESATTQNITYERRLIAELGGAAVLEVQMPDSGKIPNSRTRRIIHDDISSLYRENLLIFLDNARTQSLWYWAKKDSNKQLPREHLYVKGQPGDLALGKLENMVFAVSDFDETGNVSVLEVAKRLQKALDIEQVTKRFYVDFQRKHDELLDEIVGIDDERDRRWYASVLLNRLMFIYFLQRKWFLDNGKAWYLQDKLAESRERGEDLYYKEFLHYLFFEGFAKPEEERSERAKELLGKICYLNGGLFLPHSIEKRWPNIEIPDKAFEKLFKLFSDYTWNLDDTPGGRDDEISPHVLGYIFEKYINQKAFGAYYTRPEITEYLCEQTIHNLILEKMNALALPGTMRSRRFDSMDELITNLDAPLCRDLLDILPKISILDPACGSGAFLVSAMNTLLKIYGAITGTINILHDAYLTNWLQQAHAEHGSLGYYLKKKIITENLFGVDLMEEAMEIAKLRLFLALVSSAQTVEQLEPLPNIDFNILPGNSLIGFLQVNEERLAQLSLFQKSYPEVVAEKNRAIAQYKSMSRYTKNLQTLRDGIQQLRESSITNLNELLLDDFKRLGIKYEQAIWDDEKQKNGKTLKRTPRLKDIEKLRPFHWGYEFDQVMNARRGFDIIITNPPWDILKPLAKEFFSLHSKLVSKNKMRIEEFDKERDKLLQSEEIRDAWLDYQSSFPFQSAYLRACSQYPNQVSIVNGKKAGTDINLYKLFTEQCYNLLREGGQCGIVLPSGIYTDLGAKQLREMLFSQTHLTGLFGFENRKLIFEGVDSRFKFVVLTFEKGGQTEDFPAAFMRQEATELEHFPKEGALPIAVETIRRFSPDSLSIMELKHEIDMAITQKALKHALLGEKFIASWNISLAREFDMTNDSHLFETESKPDCAPLYEGKMIHQYTHTFHEPRYWIDNRGENALRQQEIRRIQIALDELAIVDSKTKDISSRTDRVSAFLENLGYLPISLGDVYIAHDAPRLAFRDIARNTDERTLISSILPSGVFAGNTLNYVIPWRFNAKMILNHPPTIKECYEPSLYPEALAYLCGILNSFTLDYIVRFRVTTHVNMFYFYQLPVPRLAPDDPRCIAIATRVARLVCVGPEFDDLRSELLGNVNAHVATESEERYRLRSEIDGLVAHLYGLTEDEFKHVLDTFPLVKAPIKDAALKAYQSFALDPDDLQLFELIAKGEAEEVDFKVAACWNAKTNQKDDKMKSSILREVAAFLNKEEGGLVLIGVADDGTIVGLEDDYKAANPQKKNRDGYELFLLDAIKDYLNNNWSSFYRISFSTIQGIDICKIHVDPAPEPVFVKDGVFLIRDGRRARPLSAQETFNYCKNRWK